MQSLFQHDQNSAPDSNEHTGQIDLPYRVWFLVGVVATFIAIWSTEHYELLAKIAWTLTAPGFTLSQTWKQRHDLLSMTAFGVVVLVHCGLMQIIFPFLPKGHYGYILVIAIVEIMTIGLAYQVWFHLRQRKRSS